tara:strand:+ start:6920 stop:8134 length:1215 start_codon:yes stop_codon:yes gene_type:complete
MLLNELRKLINQIRLEEALEKGVKEVKHPFKAVFIFGPAGAGKTTTKDFLGLPDEFVPLTSDDAIEKVFPKFGISLDFREEYPKKTEIRKLLQQRTSEKTIRKVNQMLPLFFDTTGENVSKLIKIMDALERVGYDIAVFQINVPPDVSIAADLGRDRTLGSEIIQSISNDYQRDVAKGAAYLNQLGRRGVTLLSNSIYPNIFHFAKPGTLRPGVPKDILWQGKLKLNDPEGKADPTYIDNPFYGASEKENAKILNDAKKVAQEWISDRNPKNPIGRVVLNALSYIQSQGVADLGDQMSDIAKYIVWATENGKPVPPVVNEASKALFDLEAKLRKTTPAPKKPGKDVTAKSVKGVDGPVPASLLPTYADPATPIKSPADILYKDKPLKLRELRDFVSQFNKKNKP